MTNLELLDILGNVQGKYIIEAQSLHSRKTPVRRMTLRRAFALFVAVLTIMTLLCVTAMAVSEDFRNYVFDIIGVFLPPKTETIVIEGLEEEIQYSSFGEIPDATGPGFAIYNDYASYTMTEENGTYYIRPIPVEGVDSSQYPPCEMIIEHSDTDRETLSKQIRQQMLLTWESVSEIDHWEFEIKQWNADILTFHANNGQNWDSPVEEHYFYSDGKTGSYHISAKYFLEATEGHGIRFQYIAKTFTLVTDEDVASVRAQQAAREEIRDLARDFAQAWFNHDAKTIHGFLVEDYNWPIDTYSGEGTISDILVKDLIGIEDVAIGSTYTVSVEFRQSAIPDMLQYLSISCIRQADGWKVYFYGQEG